MRKYRNNLVWIGLGVLALLLRWALDPYPAVIEAYYSRGFFLGVRLLVDYTIAWLPFPVLYLVVAALLWRAGYWGWKCWRWQGSWMELATTLLTGLLAFAGGAVFFFLVMWGFNYGRVPVEEQLALDLQPLSEAELKQELFAEAESLKQLRRAIPGAGTEALGASYLPESLETHLRHNLEQVLREQGYQTVGRVRAKMIYPRGIFLRFSSSGMYFPWTGEGQVDAGLDPLSRISVMAHELSHGYGFGDEGTCNFWAYLACAASSDPLVAYAGKLDHFRTLAANFLRYDREAYRAFRESLPLGIQADLDAINANLRRYPDIMPNLRYAAYDTYLKAQGIPEGMKNYSRVIMMVKAWKEGVRG